MLSRLDLGVQSLRRLGLAALAFDFAVVTSYVLVLSFETETPIRQVLAIVLIEAVYRYGVLGGVVLVLASVPVLAGFEGLRSGPLRRPVPLRERDDAGRHQVLVALVVGWLVLRLRGEAEVADARPAEAERLRDELGRRADVLDAANRCARALGSSLELDEAFGAFIRELRGC